MHKNKVKIKGKYLWVKVLVPVLMLSITAFYIATPEKLEFKEIVMIDQLPENYKEYSHVIIASNRNLDQSNPDHILLGGRVDPSLRLKYGVALELNDHFELFMMHDLKSILDLFPQQNLIVYVHGDGKSLEKTLWRTSLMKDAYKGDIMVFSWPTKRNDLNGLDNFTNSIKNAELSTQHLSLFLHELNDVLTLNDEHKSILFHSLGNYLLERTQEAGLIDDLSNELFDNVVLNAAAVDSENHSSWVRELSFQKEIYVVSSKNDMNLRGAQYFTSLGYALGQEPKGIFVEDVYYIDMSKALGYSFNRSKSHSYFVGDAISKNKYIYKFYQSVFEGNEQDIAELGQLNNETGSFIINKNAGS